MEQSIGFIGTYTKAASEGIYAFILDKEKRRISEVKLAAKLENPTYLTISNDKQYLYAVVKSGTDGGVAAFSIAENCTLRKINQETSAGAPPCHVSVSEHNQIVLSANYHKGTIEAYAVDAKTGGIHPNPAIIRHEGSGPDPRQEKAHAHFAGFTPDKRFVVAIDLGIDEIITYKLADDNQLQKVAGLKVKPGSGPRHLVFHPNQPIAYIMTEFSSEVLVLHYEAVTGTFKQIQAISTLPPDFTANNQGSAIQISTDGRFIYAGNRGHNSIAVFSVDAESGELEFIEHTATEGQWPRDFALDPSEEYVVASNQESNTLALFARDSESGKLTLLQKDIHVPEPVCVKFFN